MVKLRVSLTVYMDDDDGKLLNLSYITVSLHDTLHASLHMGLVLGLKASHKSGRTVNRWRNYSVSWNNILPLEGDAWFYSPQRTVIENVEILLEFPLTCPTCIIMQQSWSLWSLTPFSSFNDPVVFFSFSAYSFSQWLIFQDWSVVLTWTVASASHSSVTLNAAVSYCLCWTCPPHRHGNSSSTFNMNWTSTSLDCPKDPELSWPIKWTCLEPKRTWRSSEVGWISGWFPYLPSQVTTQRSWSCTCGSFTTATWKVSSSLERRFWDGSWSWKHLKWF